MTVTEMIGHLQALELCGHGKDKIYLNLSYKDIRLPVEKCEVMHQPEGSKSIDIKLQ